MALLSSLSFSCSSLARAFEQVSYQGCFGRSRGPSRNECGDRPISDLRPRLGFLREIPRNSRNFHHSDVISATGIWKCLYDHGSENPRKCRGNTVELPRKVDFSALAREFRGNGNRSPSCDRRGLTQQLELVLELIQTQMAQKPMLRAEVGMRVRCASKASAE